MDYEYVCGWVGACACVCVCVGVWVDGCVGMGVCVGVCVGGYNVCKAGVSLFEALAIVLCPDPTLSQEKRVW